MNNQHATPPLNERIAAAGSDAFNRGLRIRTVIITTFKEMLTIADELLGTNYSIVTYDHKNPFKNMKERSEMLEGMDGSVSNLIRRVSWPGNHWAVMGILPGQQGRRFWAFWMQVRPFEQGIEASFGGHEPIRLSLDAWDDSKKTESKERMRTMIRTRLEGLVDMLSSIENVTDYSFIWFSEAEGSASEGSVCPRPNLVSDLVAFDGGDVAASQAKIPPLGGTRLWSSVAIGLNARLCD